MTGPRVAKPYTPCGIRKRPELFFSPLSFKKHCLTSSFATERANHAGSAASLTSLPSIGRRNRARRFLRPFVLPCPYRFEGMRCTTSRILGTRHGNRSALEKPYEGPLQQTRDRRFRISAEG